MSDDRRTAWRTRSLTDEVPRAIDEFVLEWPQTHERFRGQDTFAAVNEHYPAAGRWRFTINRLVAGEGEGVSDVRVTDGVRVDRAISFFELRDGRIWRLIEMSSAAMRIAVWRPT